MYACLNGRLRRTASGVLFLGVLLAKPCLAGGLAPIIVVPPLSQTVSYHGNATFSVVASSLTTMDYQWLKDSVSIAGATASSYTVTNAHATDAGVYAVKVTNAGGTVTSSGATLTVLGPPEITNQPSSQVVVQGQNASFSVGAVGTGTLHYRWSLDSAQLGPDNSTLTISNAGTNNAGNYVVVVNNSYGSVTSAVATLTVEVPAGITTQPQNQTAVQGQTASFSVAASGTAPLSYQWNFNGSGVPVGTNGTLALTNATLVLANVQSNQAGNYTVVVTNPWGSVTSAVATLTVNVSPTVTTQPQSQVVTQGQNVTFSVVATGTAPFHYKWYLNGSQLGPDNSTLTINNVGANNSGNYAVVVNNSWGSVTSSVAALTFSNPIVTLSVPASEGMSVSGFTFQLTLPAGGTYVIQASTDLQAWTPIITNVASTSIVVYTDTAAAAYRYRFYRAVLR
jgi:hypothetical protein